MIGHITYLSEQSMREKFGRQLYDAEKYKYDFDSEFAVETYLDYQGQSFVERFDANSYLYITKAMDYFDLAREYGTVRNAFAGTKSRFLVISFSSDWLFPTSQSEEIAEALSAEGKDVTYCNIHSPYGHDAFLLECPSQDKLIAGFLKSTQYRVRTGHTCHCENATPSKHLKTFERLKRARVDYELIDAIIAPNSRVLDMGCGDGELLSRLIGDKNVEGLGIELEEDLVVHCVQNCLSVLHRDIERGLPQFATDSFDYVILSQTLQTLRDPEKVIRELLRIGKKVIVSFPNFAHWTCRLQMFFGGRAPQTRQLPFRWHNSPNIHFLSIKDFDRFCAELNIHIEKKIPLGRISTIAVKLLPNLLASQAVYVTSKYQND
jgi:homoserine O-acetyltransferase